MDGPFHIIRNEFQRTPLQRIDDAINSAKNHLFKLETENSTSKKEIDELKNTISTLQEERENRKKKKEN